VHARRFLHCAYCCDDADRVTALLEAAFGLRVAMRTSGARGSGAILGLDGEIEARASFACDARGPRTSPAIEVQAWVDPPAIGTPHASANRIGIQAIGIAVPDLDAAIGAAARLGAVATSPPARDAVLGARAATLRDANGVRFDLVEETGPASRLRHVRLTCRDLDRSLAWYLGTGFRVERRADLELAGGAFGESGRVAIRSAHLVLPDEPMALLLCEWVEPASTGAAYELPYHRGLYRIALAVDDTRASAAALAAAGHAILRPPMQVELAGTRVPSMWIAFLRDPDGIPVELVERPRSAFR
jgi:catechol 2,3-dioxygenase-like lactoylglutathione lyase family enzyme